MKKWLEEYSNNLVDVVNARVIHIAFGAGGAFTFGMLVLFAGYPMPALGWILAGFSAYIFALMVDKYRMAEYQRLLELDRLQKQKEEQENGE